MTRPYASGDPPVRLAAFAALGVAQAVVYLALATWPGYQAAPKLVVALAGGAFLLYLAALSTARPLAGGWAFLFALALGLLFRALLVPKAPFLSDDYFRYLWDGTVQLRGINPYRYAPADSALAGVDDAVRAQVNHPHVNTIYPPLAQIAFALNAAMAGGWLSLKLLWLACDAGIAALVYRLVPSKRRLQLWTLYWWSPLVVVEVAWNAHLDLLGALPIVAAVWLTRRPGAPSSRLGLTVAAGALVKPFPLAMLPAAARGANAARVTATFVACLALAYIPYVGAGRHLFAGLVTYAAAWRFNDGLFVVLAWLTGSPFVAKIAAVVIILLFVVQSVRDLWTFERTALWMTGAMLILSPTVHPWYLLWMVPLIAIRPNRAWLYLSGSVFAAYYGLATYRSEGVWPEPWWLRLAIYGPFFLLLVGDAWRGSGWPSPWRLVTTRR
ncbi:MAG: hypothetical protein PVJ43_02120 [Gemmatimonadales bacterium]